MTSSLEKGRALLATLNPTFESVVEGRYGGMLPGFGETLVEFAYGRLYARPGLDLKTRQIATVAALAAMGGQTAPQLKANIEHALTAGATETEIAEVILQMSVYGGMPATINALNAAQQVFDARAAAPKDP